MTIRIGLLIPLQGPSGLWGPSCEACARLAVHELNGGRGLLDEAVELVPLDSGAPRQVIARQIARARRRHGIKALVGMHTSDLRAFVAAQLPPDMPYVYTPLYEGSERAPNIFAIGETPDRLLAPGIVWLAEERRVTRWFLLGNDYVWPRIVHGVAARLIGDEGGRIVGTCHVPLGSDDFAPALAAIARSGAQAVVVSLIGQDAVHFNRAFAQAGLAARLYRFSTAVEENVIYGIGADNTENMILTSGYFADLRTAANDAFRERYHTIHGDTPPMQNDIGESCYEGLQFLAGLGNRVGSLSARALRGGLRGMPAHRTARSHLPGGARSVHLATVEGLHPRVIQSC